MTGPLEPPGFAPTGGRVELETAEFSRFDGTLVGHHTVVLECWRWPVRLVLFRRRAASASAQGSGGSALALDGQEARELTPSGEAGEHNEHQGTCADY